MNDQVNLAGAIPATPLLLDDSGRIDWARQRALLRYYLDAGVDGLAVGVHTTQFELHDDPVALRELWTLVRDEVSTVDRPVTLVAGVCGDVPQAHAEATVAAELGFAAALLCSSGMAQVTPEALLQRARAVGDVMPTIGFYLQESVGGVHLPETFWSELVDIDTVVGIKAAPFDRYRTRDVARSILRSDRWDQVALLTGNDDAIIADLVTPHRLDVSGQVRELRVQGGLLGQFAVGTRAAVRLTHQSLQCDGQVPTRLLALGQDLTEVNAAVFDVANNFAGCVAGVNEVLRQQGIAASATCLSEAERVSEGQSELIRRVRSEHPWLLDEEFIAENRDRWLNS